MRSVNWARFITITLLIIYSYGFVDFSVPLSVPFNLPRFLFNNRFVSVSIYSAIFISLFIQYGVYLYQAYKKKLKISDLMWIVVLSALLLFFSYPAFSNDIYNYIATSKVTYLYGENPYVVMPIELPSEPMLVFMHAANKTALYGLSWILLSFIPYVLGGGNLFQTLFMFKLLAVGFYLGSSYLIYLLSKKNIFSVVLFALNPLVVIESLVSAHNDIAMIFFALLSFYLLKKRIAILAFVSIFISIGIKFATIVLIPILTYLWIRQRIRKKVNWEVIWQYSALSLFAVFLLSPIREEMYPWYFQWVIAFTVLLPNKMLLQTIAIALSFGLSFRFAPYVYTRNWGGVVPVAKQIVTVVPVIMITFVYVIYRYIPLWRRK